MKYSPVMRIIFIVCALAVYWMMHFSVYRTLVKGFVFLPRARKWLFRGVCLAALSFPAGEIFFHLFSVTFILRMGYFWLGLLSISFTCSLVFLPLMKCFKKKQSFLARGFVVLVLSLSLFSWWQVARGPRVKNVTMAFDRLPDPLQNFTIVFLTDLHLDFRVSEADLDVLVRKVNDLQGDLIVFGGDIVENNRDPRRMFAKKLGQMKARYKKLGVTGNHEFYGNVKLFENFARGSGIELLRNRKTVVLPCLEVLGWDDSDAVIKGGKGPDEDLLSTVDENRLSMLVFHRPEKFSMARLHGIDIQLSGHTHAGQIPPLDFIVRLFYRFSSGLNRVGDAYIYTSPGTGVWGPPMRLFSRSEITRIRLTRSSD